MNKINKIINKIIENQKDCYFISPHLDDAAFSCGGLLYNLSNKTKVTVINVFTRAGQKPITLSAKAYLKQCQHSDPKVLFNLRKFEDNKTLTKYGIKVINLDQIDALFRLKNNLSSIQKLLGKFLPELIHIYPTYRFQISKGKISNHDNALKTEVANKLLKVIKNNSVIFCPIGIGNHVDHLLTREICRKTFSNVCYWTDFPYNQLKKPDSQFLKHNNLIQNEIHNNWEAKKNLIMGYQSQVKAIFPDNKIPNISEIYYI